MIGKSPQKLFSSWLRLALLLALVVPASGCAWLSMLFAPRAVEAPPVIHPTSTRHPALGEGSLWAGDNEWSLFADDKARDIGDLVMVQIIEESEAERKSSTEIERDSDIDAGFQNFFGNEAYFGDGRRVDRDSATGELKGGMQDVNLEHLIRSKSETNFDSDATLKQSGKVLASVMAQVVESTPQGNMRIFGSQVVTINNEDQVVSVTGVIRRSDVTPANSIPSNLIADARIVYSGRGPASDATRPGFGFRIFYALWPF